MGNLGSSEEFDPYKFVEVEHKRCIIFTIRLIEGRNITKGKLYDFIDTPDPYVVLRVKTSPEGTQTTEPMSNTKNPKWNKKFQFLLDGDVRNILEITLMESDPVLDDVIGTEYFHLDDLPLNKTVKNTFIFNEVTEIDAELRMEYDTKPVLRYSLSLCDEEKQFLKKRKVKVMKGMRKLLGVRGPKELSHVPTVAVIGSGGGFRAMVGLNGAVRTLSESGVFDCVTYFIGGSGSSWYISTLYSHPEWPRKNPDELTDELKNSIDSSVLALLSPLSLCRYIGDITDKRNRGQPVSFTDFFGHLVGETLLKDRHNARLTDQQRVINNGDVPFPLYTCVHVKKNVPAVKFQEWVEISPYEVGIPKYGTSIKSHLFDSKVFLGQLSKQYVEPPLHYIQGICGSAYSILWKRLFGNKDCAPNTTSDALRQEMSEKLDAPSDYVSSDSSDTDEEEVGQAEGEKQEKSDAEDDLKSKRKFQKGKPLVTQKSKQKAYWTRIVDGINSITIPFLESRSGLAAAVLNPLRGDPVRKLYPYSPFPHTWADKEPMDDHEENSPTDGDTGNKVKVAGNKANEEAPESDNGEGTSQTEANSGPESQGSGCVSGAARSADGKPDESDGCSHRKAYMVDAGLAMNLPFPPVVRPQRQVDVILSFDFSARESDSSTPFKELLMAEVWARLQNLPFPPIDISSYAQEDMKEVYVFRHPTDPHCPIVVHFVLANINFRKYKAPGVPRESEDELEFADFSIFDDFCSPYSTFNFKYSHRDFDRLSELMKFNTLSSIATIKEIIAESVEKKRTLPPKLPLHPVKPKLPQKAKKNPST